MQGLLDFRVQNVRLGPKEGNTKVKDGISFNYEHRLKWVMRGLVFGTGGQGVSLRHCDIGLRGGLYCRPTTLISTKLPGWSPRRVQIYWILSCRMCASGWKWWRRP